MDAAGELKRLREYTARHRVALLAASANCVITATGARRSSRHASNNARWTTLGTFCVEAMPTHRLSSSAKMPAASGPPILATAAAASAFTELCSSVGVFNTISRSRSSAVADASCPTAKTASRCTVESGSDISLSNIRTAAGFPIRPMAKAAWLRTIGSGWRAAARNKEPVKRLVSYAARIPANASTTASSCARSGGATQDTSITLKTNRIRYGRQELPHFLGDRRDGMVGIYSNQGSARRCQKLTVFLTFDRMAELDPPTGHVTHPTSHS